MSDLVIPEVGKIFTLKMDSSIFIMRKDEMHVRGVSPRVFLRPEGFWMNLMPRDESRLWRYQLAKGFNYLSKEQLAKRSIEEHWSDNLGILLEEFHE